MFRMSGTVRKGSKTMIYRHHFLFRCSLCNISIISTWCSVGKKRKKVKGPDAANKLPGVTPHTKCRLRLLKMERIKDYLLMEEEFIRYVVHFNL